MTTQFCLCLYLLTCASLALVFRPCTVSLDALSQLVNNSADGFTHFTSFPRSAVYQYWWAFLVLQCLRILLDPVQYFLVMEWHPFHIRLWSFNWLINGSCCCTELVGVVCLQLFQLLRVSPQQTEYDEWCAIMKLALRYWGKLMYNYLFYFCRSVETFRYGVYYPG